MLGIVRDKFGDPIRVAPAGLFLLALLSACKDPPHKQNRKQAHQADEVVFLEGDAHLLRASMAIRGIRPSLADLEAVRADPAVLPSLVERYVASSEFGETTKDMWGEILQVRADTMDILPANFDLSWSSEDDIYRATSEAPLRLIEAVVVEDRPFSDVVADDFVYADEVLVDVYGLDGWDPDGPEVQPLAWSDGREGAGVLSSTTLWRRHESNGSNFHRGRANLIAKTFLCDTIDSRDIVVEDGIDLSDELAVAEAVTSLDTCIGCHQSLDPLAGYFWGFKKTLRRSAVFKAHNRFDCVYPYKDYCYPIRMYDPMTENHWEDYDLRPPSFYGYEVSRLDGLGDAIGADPRFAMCMTRQFGAYLLQVDKEEIPFDQVVAWRDAFVASGLSAQSLVSEIVRSDLFRAVSVTGEDAPPSAGMLVIRPEQYARTLRDLTGFRFVAVGGCEVGACWDKVDLAVTDLYGFRAMSGGIDGFQSTRPVHTATPTKFLAMGKIAAEAAGSVVDADVATADASDRYLLTAIDPGETSEAAIRQQLVLLHDRILGERLDASDEEIDATLALFSAARDRYQGDDVAAWKVTIAALLQDVRVTFY